MNVKDAINSKMPQNFNFVLNSLEKKVSNMQMVAFFGVSSNAFKILGINADYSGNVYYEGKEQFVPGESIGIPDFLLK